MALPVFKEYLEGVNSLDSSCILSFKSDKVIESESYVMVFKDNTKLELYMYMTNEEFTEYVLPILENKEIQVKTVDFIENIPKVEETEVVE